MIITPTEMFRELRDTHDEVKALGPRIDALTSSTMSRVDGLEERDVDHEKRIRSLERARWVYVGAGTVLASVTSFLVSYLLK